MSIWSELDVQLASDDALGEDVTLRRAGQPDVTVRAMLRTGLVEENAPGITRDYVVPQSEGVEVKENDTVILADGSVYRVGPSSQNKASLSWEFRCFRAY